MMIKGLLILGFGGHARSVADVALSIGVQELIFVDQNARENENFLGFPVIKEYHDSLPTGWYCFPASGNNYQRKLQVAMAETNGWPLTSLIAATASLGTGSQIAPGTFIAHHAHVGPMATVGIGCILNTGCIIEHECVIGEYTHISINATIAGRSSVGNLCTIFAGAVVIDSVNVLDNVTVGAGGIVTRDINSAGLYTGIPAKFVRK